VGVARRATISDLARAAAVSVGTASNVLNGKGRHAETTRLRVIEAARNLQFVPNALIRSLQTGTTNAVGVFTWRLERGDWHDVTFDVLRGISRGLAEHGMDVLLYAAHPHEHNVEATYFLDGRVDAVVLAPGGLDREGIEAVAGAGVPVVALYQSDVPERVASVCIDNRMGVFDAMAHLVALGHRRIAFIGPTYTEDFRERRDAYGAGLARHGLRFDPDMCSAEGLGTPDTVGPELARLLSLGRAPTALLCANDGYALAVLELLRQREVAVPNSVSVVGFDGSAQALTVGLSTVRQPAEEVGAQAAQYARALVGGATLTECRTTLPVTYVAARTTAPVGT
jgi:LacI family transcriptional regulator